MQLDEVRDVVVIFNDEDVRAFHAPSVAEIPREKVTGDLTTRLVTLS